MAQKGSPRQADSERSLRNPRRRNRVESESIKVAPRRKRSKITETTFLPRDSPGEYEEEEQEVAEVHTNGNGRVVSGRSNGRITSVSLASEVDMAVRGPRNSIKRTTRADGAKVLTQNANYSVKLLSSTPKELSREGVDFRGSISASANLALAVTHDKAYIWDYNGLSGAAIKSVDITFSVSQHEPLPLGAFVTSNGNGDTGLLICSASSGKIIYHESIERVTSLDFFQERREGVEGAITGLFSGEKVVQLVNADPAGFVALLSSGRTVHISLRDGQGRPKITTQVLYTPDQTSGGLFGSIKSIFGAASWKQSISALRVRALERGQVQVLGLMEKGELRIWDLDWSGRYEFRSSADFREQLQHELRQMRPAERHGEVDHMALLDIAVLDKTSSNKLELVSLASGRPLDALVLVRCGAQGMHNYALVQFSLVSNDFTITRILDVQTSSRNAPSAYQARLLLPAPGHTALVLLPDSVAILSLASTALNPEAQFHETSYIEPSPFQDTVYLQADRGFSFTGGDSDISRNMADSSSIVYVNGAGFVRITTHETQSDSDDTAALAKNRVEQAVFYGFQDGTLLDLLRPNHARVADEDIEMAALSLSNDILHSSSRFFELPPVSVSANLQKRAEAASHLAIYLQKLHPDLPHSVKWQLLTNAEKIAAGLKLWNVFEAHHNTAAKGRRKASMLHEACEMVNQKRPFDLLWSSGSSDDIVRTFFVTQLEHVNMLLPWTRRVLENLRENDLQSSPELLRLISEADDIWLSTLQTAYNYRRDNASQFGVHLKMIELDTAPDPHDLQDVTELWTSADDLLKDITRFIDTTRTAVQELFETNENLPDSLIKKVAQENGSLVDLMCQIYLERIAWCRSKGLPKFDVQAQRLLEGLDILRHNEIRQLAEIGQAEAGIVLADKYRDMKTLTECLIAESQYLEEAILSSDTRDRPVIKSRMDDIIKKVNKYFEKFGQDFAEAFFGEGFAAGSGTMLSEQHEWDDHMTEWLQRDPSRAKACWINDIIRVRDFKHASQCLHDVAIAEEEVLWNKSVELSLAKLAMHAHFESVAERDDEQVRSMDADIHNGIQVVDTQRRFHEHILSETYGALDEEAAVVEVMRSAGTGLLAFSTWESVTRSSVAKVLAHQALEPEELIDVLTHLSSEPLDITDRDLDRSETFEALTVLAALKQHPADRLDTLAKLIWKRAYLHADWEDINKHAAQQSELDVQELLRKTDIYRTMTHLLNAELLKQETGLRIMLPTETLDAGTHIADVATYIPAEIRPQILEENIIMERQLENFIKKYQIEHWVQSTKDLAEEAVNGPQQNGHLTDANGEIKEEEVDEPTDLTGIEQAPGHFDSDIEMDG